MKHSSIAAVYSPPHESRLTAFMCLLLCITLNIQWLAANHSTTTASNSSSSASLGATVGLNGTGGVGVSATANVARGTGSHSATSTTYTNTHIQAGNQTGNTLTLHSGGDTNLIGATASGNQIIANIGTGPNGGNLTIQSLQDQSTYRESNQSTSIGGSVPIIGAGTASVNANASRTNINSTYQSVTEQSSLAAGNGGFQINVQGTTSLTGATITSTQSAVDNNANTLATQSINATSLANSAAYNAQSTSIGISYSGANASGTQSGYNGFNATPPSTLSATGSANSTTQSRGRAFSHTASGACHFAQGRDNIGRCADGVCGYLGQTPSEHARPFAPGADRPGAVDRALRSVSQAGGIAVHRLAGSLGG